MRIRIDRARYRLIRVRWVVRIGMSRRWCLWESVLPDHSMYSGSIDRFCTGDRYYCGRGGFDRASRSDSGPVYAECIGRQFSSCENRFIGLCDSCHRYFVSCHPLYAADRRTCIVGRTVIGILIIDHYDVGRIVVDNGRIVIMIDHIVIDIGLSDLTLWHEVPILSLWPVSFIVVDIRAEGCPAVVAIA